MAITVSEFLSDLKLRGQIQSNQNVLSDADFLTLANRELQMVLVPKILSVRERYFSGFKDYSIGAGRRVRIPPRAAGGRLFDLKFYPNGLADTQSCYSIKMNHASDVDRGQSGFYLDGDDLVLNSGAESSGVLRVYYPIRPPKMVTAASASTTIASVSGSSITLAVSQSAGTYEAIRTSNGCMTISPNLSVNGTAASDTDDKSSDVTGRFAAGDIVCTANQSANVPLPEELVDWLSQRVLLRVLEALGHAEEATLAGNKLGDIEKDALALLSPRIENSEKVILDKEALGWRLW